MKRALALLSTAVLLAISCGSDRAVGPERALLCPDQVDTVRIRVGDSTYLELLRRCQVPLPASSLTGGP